jgi:hypothetical protein
MSHGDDLGATMRVLAGPAEGDGATLQFPTAWASEEPWADLDPDHQL